MLLAIATLASSPQALAASPAEIAAQRQQILNSMLTNEFEPSQIAGLRQQCAAGSEPASVTESRRQGAYFTPDAADRCVAALVRTARDHRLSELYSKLLAELGGSAAGADQFPRTIGAVVLKGIGKVPIGNNTVITVTPAIAFDAGFSAAYQERAADNLGTADPQQLKALAEDCLGQRQDVGTCFSAGYMYGAHALMSGSAH